MPRKRVRRRGRPTVQPAGRRGCFDARDPSQARPRARVVAVPRRAEAPAAGPLSRERLSASALDHVRQLEERQSGAPLAYQPDAVQRTAAGVSVVHLQQRHLGLPVYEARRAVHFAPDGSFLRALGEGLAVPGDTPVEPLVGAAEAALAAARHLAARTGRRLRVSAEAARVTVQFSSPERPTLLDKAPFRDGLTAHLALFHCGADVRLVWVTHLVLPRGRGAYELLVAADRPGRPEVLLCRSTSACAIDGGVFAFDPREPRERVPFPQPAAFYPQLGALPAGFPWPWVQGSATDGNNVRCFDNNGDLPLEGALLGGNLSFDASPADGVQQRVLNAFYVCNFLHDFFYLLGFDEQAGNFQRKNRGTLGRANDNLIVQCFSSADVDGAANMRSRSDGRSPVLALGLFELPDGQKRHTALDGDVVVHEFAHGVTNRMIGGLAHHDPLRGQSQSEAMGEGFSDYFAVTIRNYYRRRAGRAESAVFGAWISGEAPGGWRRQSYDEAGFQGDYAGLGSPALRGAHDAGQVWCQALLNVHRRLAGVLGGDAAARDRADELGWRLVVASLPICRDVQPHFLDGRDAILSAFDDLDRQGRIPGNAAAQKAAVREAFRALGMGAQARSRNASYTGIVADFT